MLHVVHVALFLAYSAAAAAAVGWAFPKPHREPKPRKPLRRSSPPRRRLKPRRVAVERDEEFKTFVRSLPCLFTGDGRHHGPSDPDHAAQRTAMGRKEGDTSCIPLCRRCHRDREALAGVFKGWAKARMRAWCDEQIEFVRRLFEDRVEAEKGRRARGLAVPPAAAPPKPGG